MNKVQKDLFTAYDFEDLLGKCLDSELVANRANLKRDSELEKCKQTLARYEQMLAVAEKTLEWIQAGFAGMWGCPEKIWYEEALETAPDKIEQALAKIEEMRAQK